MTLNLATYEPLPALAPEKPEQRRNPFIATCLSLLFPGLGHLYLGLRRHAAWLIAVEALSLLTIYAGAAAFYSQAILIAPTIYLFAIADAYCSAREWNAGVLSWMTGANPRVAAVLNLLTKGLGYFYLGDRTKGIIFFLVMSALQSALLIHTNVWTSILAITLQIAVAADAYRVGRERLLQQYPELKTDQNLDGTSSNLIEEANPGGLKPSLVMGLFTALVTIFLISFATLRAISGHAVVSNGSLERGPAGLVYRNPAERIEVTVPDDWESSRGQNILTVLAGEGASIVVQEQYAIFPVSSLLQQTQKELEANHANARFTQVQTSLDGRSAKGIETSYTNKGGVEITQRILAIRRGLKIFILIETWTTDKSRPALDGVEGKIHLG